VHADVSHKGDVEAMGQQAVGTFCLIDAVVNNAGILIDRDRENLKEEHWASVIDVNAKGTFLVVQAVLPYMKIQKYGRIGNMSSIGGPHGAPELAL
ncbi:SDR family NAD(P)-dependent oxidoreductase, partial [Brucella oryzae]